MEYESFRKETQDEISKTSYEDILEEPEGILEKLEDILEESESILEKSERILKEPETHIEFSNEAYADLIVLIT